MAGEKVCPRCKSVNRPTARRCHCGHDYGPGPPPRPAAEPPPGRVTARRLGAGCLVLAPLVLVYSVGFLLARPLPPGEDDAVTLGRVCGSVLPGLFILLVGLLLRRVGTR